MQKNSLKASYYLKKLRKNSKCNEPEYTTKNDNNPVITTKMSCTYGTYIDILAEKQKQKMQGIDDSIYKKTACDRFI